jgi:hypothetical protein
MGLVFSTNSVQSHESVYYTTYDENNGELCHGIHEGDIYHYELFAGSQTLYLNGTIKSGNSENYIYRPKIVVTSVPEKSSYDRNSLSSIVINYTEEWPTYTSEPWKRFDSLESMGENSYFVFTDWGAWINMFHNLTQESIDNTSDKEYSAWHRETYDWGNVHDIFTLVSMSTEGLHSVFVTSHYNKSDGSLISTLRQTQYNYAKPDNLGRLSSSSWEDTHLISKEKKSNEITCLDHIIQERSENEDSPLITYSFFLLLIPLIRSKRHNFKRKAN